MKEKSVFILFAVFVILGGAFFFAQSRWKRVEEAQRQSNAILPVETGGVDRIQIHNSHGAFELHREGRQWRLTQPLEAKADSDEISSILYTLASLTVERSFEDVSDEEKKNYGLDAPPLQVSVEAEGTAYSVSIGKQTATRGRMYAMKSGDPRVLVLENRLRDRLEKSLYDLRDKSVFSGDVEEAGKIELQLGQDRFAAAKDDEGVWRLEEPLGARADRGQVRALLSDLRSVRIQAFTDESPGNLAAYGLADSATRMTVWPVEATPATLLLGQSATDPSRLFAKMTGSDQVFELDAGFAEEIREKALNLRDRRLASIPAHECRRVEIRDSAGVLFSASEEEGGQWRMLAPQEGTLTYHKINSLLRDLSDLEIEAFLDRPEPLSAYRLEPPDYEMTFRGNGKEETLQLGVVPPSATDEWSAEWVYALRPDETSVFAVDRLFVSLVHQDFAEMIKPPASATDEAEIRADPSE